MIFESRNLSRDTRTPLAAADLRTKILDFRGFDSSRILILRGVSKLRPVH